MALTRITAQQISDIDYKQAARAVAVSNVNLTGGAPNLVDGVTLSANNRILVTGQSTASQNGLYSVSTLGTGSNGTWVRTTDSNATGEIEAGMIVMVTEGTVYKDTQWTLITNDPIVVGTTELIFEQNFPRGISHGTSNILIPTANTNIRLAVDGTANVAVFTSYGVSLDTRPAFRVVGNGVTNNLTTTQNGSGNLNSNNFAVIYNQGSYLNTTTGVFVAPISGLYQVELVGRNSGYSGGISQLAVVKNPSGSNEVQVMVEWAANSTMNHAGGGTISKLSTNDTLELKILAGEINFDGNDNWSVAFIG